MVSDQVIQVPAEEIPGQMPDQKQASKFITWWSDRITSARTYHKKAFDRMNEDSEFVAGNQWDKDAPSDSYTVNIAQSEVAASVSTLYAKNPTFTVKRRPRMDFAIWDENPQSLQQAMMAMQPQPVMPGMTPMPPDPAAMALMADIQQGLAYRQNIDRISRTLEIVFKQQLMQQQPDFKREMKQLVRRVETCGAGYLKLDFQRLMDVKPEEAARIADVAARLAHIEALMKEIKDDDSGEYERQAEELRISLKTLQEQGSVITREGLLVHFPRTTAIIIDPACSQLRGFVGARWIAEEFHLPACKIQEIYGKEVGDGAKSYGQETLQGVDAWRPVRKAEGSKKDYDDNYRVWEVYHLDSGSVFTICEGMDEYLKEPAAPNVLLERFFPYYTLSFNDIEDESCIYPPSTVRLIRHPQKEYNRSKESLRQHRIASKPHYASADGVLSDQDRTNMEGAPAHAVIKLQALQPGQKVADLFQQIQKYPIDPNVYETSSVYEDIQRITRRSSAGMGAPGDATATADTIAADTRQVEDKSKGDDIDDFLTEFARDAGNVLIMNMSVESVKQIAGPGAAWPESNAHDLLADLYMDVQAGSSGRPNRALEVATFQRLFPILAQTPGVRPDWLAKTAIKLADANIDITEAYLEGMPSVMAMNKMAQTATGNPETDPTMQGDEGADKNVRPDPADNQMAADPGLNTVPETMTENSILQ